MFWRLTRSEFSRGCRGGNRRAMNRIVRAGQTPGILAYVGGAPAGWCSVAPREDFPSLGRSRVLKPLDETPVWSIVCFYIRRAFRRQGLSVGLIRAAVDYVREQGGKVLEAYPTDPGERRLDPVSSYMGVPAAFRKAGFREVARPSKVRRIFRYRIRARAAGKQEAPEKPPGGSRRRRSSRA
jgi:GNAT superfamily N-acetyltransferase